MRYCIISDLNEQDGHCIILDSYGGDSATIDLSYAQTDIIPNGSSKAIRNESPVHTILAYNNWWGSASPDSSLLFSEPEYVYAKPYAASSYGFGASKISIQQENPFQVAADYELAGDYKSALEIYYDIIEKESDTAFKRRAIKSIIKINHEVNPDYSEG